MTTFDRASYNRSSSIRLKEALALLPPSGMHRTDAKRYTEFRILDSLSSKILTTEHYVDDTADKAPEGIGSFGPYFRHGIILPDGEMMIGHSILDWRMSVFEYHGGWYITIINGSGRPVDFPVVPALWGSTLADVEDQRIRSEAMAQTAVDGVQPVSSYRDLLLFVHNIHRHKTYRNLGHSEKSVVSFRV